MPTTHLCTPYGPTDHPPTPARWKKRPRLALQSTSAVNSLAAPGRGAEDVKGKGKAAEGAVLAAKGARPWKEADALLQQSFSIYRTTGLHSLPLASSSTSSSQFSSFAQSLQAYISQQLALEATGSSRTGRRIKRTKRVEAGYVDVPLLGKDGARPVMVEIELGEGSDNCPSTSKSRSARTQRTSTFVFLPHATSNSFSLLLVKSAVPAAVHLFSTFLSTRFDALIHPFRIPPPRMLDLLQALVLHRDRSLAETASTDETALATNMTFAFPPNIAREGLSTMTLTLPPAILPSLTADSSSSFVSGLTAHMIQTTSIPLSSLFLVRLGAGRGTFIHSGQGAGEGGAKVKFFRGAEEGGEIRRVLEELVRAAEATRRASSGSV
ncbi:RHTO0S02e04324g1_1 [Rhodotorula toruloides]|uniref:RHTO0S02e04324g1_1 n=1 Tax=Rhodotorula toruloides TaxID=5286 RepID=A0A061AHK1_RHOTO|nr:RHTO0S02e04324g1_1 [Rhodotorula toruloides]